MLTSLIIVEDIPCITAHDNVGAVFLNETCCGLPSSVSMTGRVLDYQIGTGSPIGLLDMLHIVSLRGGCMAVNLHQFPCCLSTGNYIRMQRNVTFSLVIASGSSSQQLTMDQIMWSKDISVLTSAVLQMERCHICPPQVLSPRKKAQRHDDDESDGDKDRNKQPTNTTRQERVKKIAAIRKYHADADAADDDDDDVSKVRTRRRWSAEGRTAVQRRMAQFVALRKVPAKNDCLLCIEKEFPVLSTRTWKDVKYFVYNKILKVEKMLAFIRDL
ncbi:hypothetical protein ABVT39_017549 [Epinephelus coioides]